jgi:hypothetical protein
VTPRLRKPRLLVNPGEIAEGLRGLAASATGSLVLHAPYVQVEALQAVLAGCAAPDVVVVTTWRVADVARGSSEVEAYEYCRERGWRLLVHPRLHAKVAIADRRRAILTSANVTRPGLGLVDPANAEVGIEIEGPVRRLLEWSDRIVREATLVDDALHARLIAALEDNEETAAGADAMDGARAESRAFLLSNLPLSPSPLALIDLLERMRDDRVLDVEADARERATHDAALFELKIGRRAAENWLQLKHAFFRQPLVDAFCRFAETGRYFGECKQWLQASCVDTPTPERRHLTRHIRTLFDWCVALSPPDYAIKRPHVSEFIYRPSPGGHSQRADPRRAPSGAIQGRSRQGRRHRSDRPSTKARTAIQLPTVRPGAVTVSRV